jgi:integrase
MLYGGVYMKRVKGIYDDKQQLMIIASLTKSNGMMGVLFFLGMVTGLRISDLLALEVGQMAQTFEAYERKTGKTKVVTLTDNHWHFLEVYMIGMKATDKLFPTSRQTVHKYFKRAEKDLGLADIGTHTMRKTYAYNVFRDSGCLKTVQKSLQHKYMSVTIGYLVSGFVFAVKMAHKSKPVSKEVQPCYTVIESAEQ